MTDGSEHIEPAGLWHTQSQSTTATDSALVIQVGRDLYLSDPVYSTLWRPGETTPDECPFPGLDAFGPGQAKWFFGRETLVGELLERLDNLLQTGLGGPLLVVGPSGAGKSSLLGAGLLSAIGEGRLPVSGSARWPQLMITPGAHPLIALRAALATAGEGDATGQGQAPGSTRVVVVDQLEEIFTECGDETERSAFLAEVESLASGRGGQVPAAVVVLGMRADFYAQATAFPVLRSAMQSRQLVLGAMTPIEVRQAITAPARAAGLILEAGLGERFLRDLGVDEDGGYEAGRLPLLAHALRATWLRRDGSRLTIAGYEATGGIHGAIAKSAESVFGRLAPDGQRIARNLFLDLVRIGGSSRDTGSEGIADTRRWVKTDSIYERVSDSAAARTVLDEFTSARLLAFSGRSAGITHEALLRSWPRLRSWMDEERSTHLVRQNLEEAAETWNHEGRDTSALYTGTRLAAARTWSSELSKSRELSQIASDFLAASERRHRGGIRRRNFALSVLVVLLAVAIAAASLAAAQRAQALRQATISEAGQLAAIAQRLTSSRLDLAELFAAEAYRLNPDPQTRAALLQAVTAEPHLVRYLQATGGVSALSSSADATTVVAGASNGDVMVWNLSSLRRSVIERLPSAVSSVAVSADGGTIAAADSSAARIWIRGDGIRQVPIPAKQTIIAAAVSPSGRYVAFGISTNDGGPASVVLFDERTGRSTVARFKLLNPSRLSFSGETELVGLDAGVGDWVRLTVPGLASISASSAQFGVQNFAVGMSATGKYISYTAGGPPVGVWTTLSAPTPAFSPPLGANGFGLFPNALAISEDGKRAAEANNGVVYVSDITTYKDAGSGSLLTLAGNQTINSNGVEFLGNSDNELLSASNDLIALWNLKQNSRISAAASIDLSMSCDFCADPGVSVSPRGDYAAITSDNGGTAMLVSLRSSFGTARMLPSNRTIYGPVTWSSDGRSFYVLTPSGTDGPSDGGGQVWSAPTLTMNHDWAANPTSLFVDETNTPTSAILTDGGHQMVEIGASGNVVLRNAMTGAVERTWRGPVVHDAPSNPGVNMQAADPEAKYAAVVAMSYPNGGSLLEKVDIINLKTGRITNVPGGNAIGVAYYGELLIIQRADGTLEVRSADGQHLIRSFAGDENMVFGPVVGASGLAVEVNSDGSAPVFDVLSGAQIGTIALPGGLGPTAISFSQDGGVLVSVTDGLEGGTGAGQLTKWDFSTNSWHAIACASAGHGITNAEWTEYVGADGPRMPNQVACK